MTGRALVAQADALALPLADESVDLALFSPPYFALRSYSTDHKHRELGSEATPAEFLAALWQVMAEVKRVLKPSGSAFVNLGDKYAAGHGGSSTEGHGITVRQRSYFQAEQRERPDLPNPPASWGTRDVTGRTTIPGTRPKSLLGLPWAFALGATGMLAALGGPDPGLDLILRAEIIADKPNGLPESVRDRVRRSHEQWFHLTRFPRYYSAIDEIREARAANYHDRPQYQRAMQLFREAGFSDAHMAAVRAVGVIDSGAGQVRSGGSWDSESGQLARQVRDKLGSYYRELCGSNTSPLGALPGSVWRIPSEPLRLPDWLGVNHYAAFASEWLRRLILAFSPPGICVACGEGRWPVVDRQAQPNPEPIPGDGIHHRSGGNGTHSREAGSATILGYACRCTPFTDWPGTGESSGPDGRYAAALEAGAYPNTMMGLGKPGLAARPKVGPWREYHLTGWQAPPTRPAVVLDCFSGTGTTVGVARRLGRIGIGLDLSFAYCRAARYRVFQSNDFGKAEGRTWAERQGTLT